MRALILSDLHLEAYPFTVTVPKGVDVVILAGDIAPASNDHRLLNLFAQVKGTPVVYIPGNHEYYGSRFDQRNFDLSRVCAQYGVHFLLNTSVVIKDCEIFGSTLWTGFSLYGDAAKGMKDAERGINDFRRCGDMNAERMLGLHTESVKEIENFKAKKGPKKVVVTHFCPHPKSVHPKYGKDPLNAYFCTDLSHLFGEEIPLFIHGHSHSSFDYDVLGSRVLANPRGYGDYENPEFNPRLVVEI